MSIPSDFSISTSEIAELAGVDVSTVSNWRRRFDGSFPAPVLDAGKRPKFDRAEILEWLKQNPQVGGPRTAPDGGSATKIVDLDFKTSPSDLKRAPRSGNAADDQADFRRALSQQNARREVVGSIAVLIDYRRRNNDPIALWDAATIREACTGQRLPEDIAQLVRVDHLDLLDDSDLQEIHDLIEPFDDLLAVYESTLKWIHVPAHIPGAEQVIPGLLSPSLVALADDNPDGIVYDPAAGLGSLLVAALKQNKGGSGVGLERTGTGVGIARRRLYLAHEEATVREGYGLFADTGERVRADLVITAPPVGFPLRPESDWDLHQEWAFGEPSRANSTMAWLQSAIAHLKPGGRAIVVTGVEALRRPGRDATVRSELVRRGAVQAIITVPGEVVDGKQPIPLAVWVLTTPDQVTRRQSVLLIGADALGHHALDPIGPVVQSFNAWMDDPDAPLDNALGISVAVTELLAPDATLEPKRWLVNPEQTWSAAEFITGINEVYEGAVGTLNIPKVIPRVRFRPAEEMPPMESLGSLQRKNVITLLRGRRVEHAEQISSETFPILTEKILRFRGPRAAVEVFHTDSIGAQVLEPGDVVIYTSDGGVRAETWDEPGWVLGRFMQAIRINDLDEITPRYLAAAIRNPGNSRFVTDSTVRAKLDLKQVEVFIPTLLVQKNISSLLVKLEIATAKARMEMLNLEYAHDLVAAGISSGLVEVDIE